MSIAELATNLVDHAKPAPAEFSLEIPAAPDGIRVRLSARASSFASAASFRARLRNPNQSEVTAVRGRGLTIVGRYFPDADYRPATAPDGLECYTLARGDVSPSPRPRAGTRARLR